MQPAVFHRPRETTPPFFDKCNTGVPGIKKKPSTSELLDWLKLLMVEDIGPELLRERDPKKLIPPLHGALLKNEQDVHLFERLAFMARREGRQSTIVDWTERGGARHRRPHPSWLQVRCTRRRLCRASTRHHPDTI